MANDDMWIGGHMSYTLDIIERMIRNDAAFFTI